MKAAVLSLLLAVVATPAPAATVARSLTSPDGRWLVEVADYRARQVFELWSTPTAGGPRKQIGLAVPALQDVRSDILISADSMTVAYAQGETASGLKWRLYATPIDRQAGSVISHRSPQPGVGFRFPIVAACSGREVRFTSDPDTDETWSEYVVPIAGGAIRTWDECRIFADGFEAGGIGAWR